MIEVRVVTEPENAMAMLGNLLAGHAPEGLGVRDGRLNACPAKPNCVSSQADDEAHRIAPIAFEGGRADALAKLDRVIAAQPGVTVVTRDAGYLYATFQTPVLGFVDDVEFAVDAARHVIDVRSASRLGYRDFGVNRKRIEALRAAFSGASA